MRRRDLVMLLCGVAAWPLAARAQAPSQVGIGITSANPRTSPIWAAFEQRLLELGHFDAIEFQQISGPDGYLEGMKELVRRKVDMLIAPGNEVALKSALAATDKLPIVMLAIDYDPVARGYVSNLARPTGNITGVLFQQIELTTKRLQILKEAFPEARGVTVFWDKTTEDQWYTIQSAGETLGLELSGIELSEQAYDYDRAVGLVAPNRTNPLLVAMSGFFFRDRNRLAKFALQHRLVSFFGTREFVDGGGLMSYGPSIIDMFRTAAEYADRIARGAKPADLPIQQPTKFELVINLRTAKALGFTVPAGLLSRADEVIE